MLDWSTTLADTWSGGASAPATPQETSQPLPAAPSGQSDPLSVLKDLGSQALGFAKTYYDLKTSASTQQLQQQQTQAGIDLAKLKLQSSTEIARAQIAQQTQAQTLAAQVTAMKDRVVQGVSQAGGGIIMPLLIGGMVLFALVHRR